MEQDPLVLSSLMWSWLEQLKDPVISGEDINAFSEKTVNPENALDSLEKVAVLSVCLKRTLLNKFVFSHCLKQTVFA